MAVGMQSGHVVDSETTHVLGIFQFADADKDMNVCCGGKGTVKDLLQPGPELFSKWTMDPLSN